MINREKHYIDIAPEVVTTTLLTFSHHLASLVADHAPRNTCTSDLPRLAPAVRSKSATSASVLNAHLVELKVAVFPKTHIVSTRIHGLRELQF